MKALKDGQPYKALAEERRQGLKRIELTETVPMKQVMDDQGLKSEYTREGQA